jgi:hypothetical protein
MSQDFSAFVHAELRKDLAQIAELCVGALALLDAMRDQAASAEAAQAKAPPVPPLPRRALSDVG